MFRACVADTPLTTEAANGFFTNIVGETFRNDNTLLASARAFLAPRIPEGETFRVQFAASNITEDYVLNKTPGEVMNRIANASQISVENTLTIHSLCHPVKASNMAVLGCLGEHFTQVFDGWEKVQRITDMFHRLINVGSLDCLCFINKELKSSILFVDNLTFSRLHVIGGALLGMVPWYFDRTKAPDELDRELVQACQQTDENVYLDVLSKIAQKYDFEAGRLRRLLGEFQTSYERQRLITMQRNHDNIVSSMEGLEREYNDYAARLRRNQIELHALEMSISHGSADSEIMDLFLSNRNLILVDVSGTEMTYIIKSYANLWEDDVVQDDIADRRGYVYNRDRNFSVEQCQKLMKAVFIDRTIKLRMCAAFRLSMGGTSISALSNYDYGPQCAGYMPNPHIHYYHCISGHTPTIHQAMERRDYVAAIMQTMGATQNLNFSDTTVMNKFYRDIFNHNSYNRAFELPDGRVVSSDQAIEWIEQQEAAAAAAAEQAAHTETEGVNDGE